MDKKIKILTISDHPLMPSGVATQTKYVIESLLKTGKYTVISLGGAIKHQNYQPTRTEEFGEDWTIYPVDGFGDANIIRSLLRTEKPDILWFMTDPRFYGWLWSIANEIRPLVPMVYYHVWDNYPYPTFNRPYYLSNDTVVTISKVTDDIVRNVAPEVDCHYIPHVVDTDIFTPLTDTEVQKLKKDNFPQWKEDKFLVFWNNRNARRKQSGAVIWWFKDFLDKVGKDKAVLLMHTEPNDPNGPDLQAIINELGLTNGEVLFSMQKTAPQSLNTMYNLADVTVNVADAEGFGLATFESLAAGTPIICTMTGGLQEQVTDKTDWFGIGLEPAAKYVIGSQEVPFIYEDKVSKEQFLEALEKMYNMTKKQRKEMGLKGRKHVLKNYNKDELLKQWDELLTKIYEEKGSWTDRKQYERWSLKEVA
jgi:glycosyltransferase involved in cell wall biosynthesis